MVCFQLRAAGPAGSAAFLRQRAGLAPPNWLSDERA
jgi:hypothetical protein